MILVGIVHSFLDKAALTPALPPALTPVLTPSPVIRVGPL